MTDLGLAGRDLITTLDYSPEELNELVDLALRIKAGREKPSLAGKVASLIFFNPSVRTRVSCESAMARLGGAGITINTKETWNFESREGVVMDGNTQEHVRELAPVLSSMNDLVGIRKSELITTGADKASVTGSYDELKQDDFIHRFREYAGVPVVNMESNRWHPLQGLADMATIKERLGPDPRGKKYVLTWAWHLKSLPVATPHSQLLSAANLGMDVTLLRPDGWGLEPEVVQAARERTEALGGSLRETDDIAAAYDGAHVVCAKAWGSLDYYGRFDEEARDKQRLRSDWIVDEQKMARTDDGIFMHCLPVRRNVVVTDGVLDGRHSAVIDEAGNRLWTAAATFAALIR